MDLGATGSFGLECEVAEKPRQPCSPNEPLKDAGDENCFRVTDMDGGQDSSMCMPPAGRYRHDSAGKTPLFSASQINKCAN
jgi:hypothetical protein